MVICYNATLYILQHSVFAMIFNMSINQDAFNIDIPDGLLDEVKPIIEDMDKDFDRGTQMGRFWVDDPSDEQRCQVAANNLVNAMYAENKRMVYVLACYILSKFPALKGVTVNTELEIQEIDIHV